MFEQLGYFKEFYINGKFMGYVNHIKKDREEIGYNGRKNEVVKELVTLDNKKKIKAGTEVMTIIYPLCGKQIGK
jgi:hypothetical protein